MQAIGLGTLLPACPQLSIHLMVVDQPRSIRIERGEGALYLLLRRLVAQRREGLGELVHAHSAVLVDVKLAEDVEHTCIRMHACMYARMHACVHVCVGRRRAHAESCPRGFGEAARRRSAPLDRSAAAYDPAALPHL